MATKPWHQVPSAVAISPRIWQIHASTLLPPGLKLAARPVLLQSVESRSIKSSTFSQGQNRAYVVHKHRLDTILECNGTRVASSASASQLQQDNSIFESTKLDISSIFLDRRSDASLQQLLDHSNYLIILFIVRQSVFVATFLCILRSGRALNGIHNLFAGSDDLGDKTKDLRFDMRPVDVALFGHRYEIGSIEDGGDALDIEQFGC